MKVMLKPFTHILAVVCLVWILGACSGTPNQKEAKNNDKNNKEEGKEIENIPTTLENFDLTYYGLFKGQRTQMNLRRYGTALSGSWWMTEADEVHLAGLLQGETEDFQLDVTSLKGDKLGHIKGKLSAGNNIKCFWKSEKGDSIGIDFLPMARNVEIFRLKIDNVKSAKSSQNNKRQITINYPQVLGIKDPIIEKRVNESIDKYFNSDTWKDSLEKGTKDFKEDVRCSETYMNNEYISLCKHHHLDRNDGNALIAEDTHGITINFKRGKIYELRDLFKPNAIEQLNKIILARISKSCNNSLDAKTLEKCKVKGEETTSFFLSKTNMTFHLTERLPSASKGCGYVRIEYKDLLELINPSGPLAEHLNTKK